MSGLQWLKWDLHIHTPYSGWNKEDNSYGFLKEFKDTDKENEIWEKFISELESSDLDVIGINDYAHICGYKKVLEFKQQGRLDNIKEIFPIVEYRMDKFPVLKDRENGTKKYANLHIIFPPNKEMSLDNLFDIVKQLGNREYNEIGKDLYRYDDFKKELSFAGVVYKLDEFKKYFKNIEDKILRVVSYSEWKDLPKSELEQNSYFNIADLFFTSSKDENKIKSRENYLENNFSSKVIFNTSDKHNFIGNKSHCNDFSNFTWVKSSPTFKSLKLALENKGRFLYKEPIFPIHHIQSIFYNGLNKFKNPDEIKFNPQLVSIIGNKSSGKSLLGASIAQKCKYTPKKDEFSKYDDFIGDNNPYNLKETLGSSTSLKVTYLSQQYIDGLTEEKNIKELDEFLKDIIFSYKSTNSSSEEITKIIDKNLSIIKNTKCLFNVKNIVEKRKNLADNLKSAYKEFTLSKNNIKNHNDFLIGDIGTKYANSSEELTTAIKDLDIIKAQDTQIQAIETTLDSFNRPINDINRLLEFLEIDTFNIEPEMENLRKKLDERKKRNKDLIEKYEINKSKARDILSKIVSDNPTIKTIDDIKNKKTNKEIEINNYKIRSKQLKTDFIKAKKEEQEHKEAFCNYFKNLYEKLEYYSSIQQNIVKEINKKEYASFKDELSKISFKASFNIYDIITHFNNNIYLKVNNQSHSLLGIKEEEYTNKIEECLDLGSCYDEVKVINFYSYILDTLCNDNVFSRLKSGSNRETYVQSLFDFNIDVKYDLMYNNRNIKTHTPGQKGIALILLLLLFDKNNEEYPLIIDQPEENLDNQTIHKILVPAFNIAKQKRQIFLITHNPNLVVNIDSDQVIIAKQNENEKISYTSGTLDDEKHIDEVCKILEGGEEALKKRSKTYNIFFVDNKKKKEVIN